MSLLICNIFCGHTADSQHNLCSMLFCFCTKVRSQGTPLGPLLKSINLLSLQKMDLSIQLDALINSGEQAALDHIVALAKKDGTTKNSALEFIGQHFDNLVVFLYLITQLFFFVFN